MKNHDVKSTISRGYKNIQHLIMNRFSRGKIKINDYE